MIFGSIYRSRLGTLSYVVRVTDEGHSDEQLVALGFCDSPPALIHHLYYGWAIIAGEELSLVPSPVVEQALDAYFDGDLHSIDALCVSMPAQGFIGEVWRRMREIPPSQTVAYRELAEMAGRPNAYRAAASACSRNPVALVVPCHRVIHTTAKDGVGSYGYGSAIKAALLDHERRHSPIR